MNQLDIKCTFTICSSRQSSYNNRLRKFSKSIYPNALSVSAWGGEDDETPRYGIVKIGVKAASGSTLTETTKADIVNKLKPYNVASVAPQIVDPETTSVLLTSTVKYNTGQEQQNQVIH